MARPRRTASPFAARDNCVNVSNHTPVPKGQLAHAEWAKQKANTHKQEMCPACGFYAIWVPKND